MKARVIPEKLKPLKQRALEPEKLKPLKQNSMEPASW